MFNPTPEDFRRAEERILKMVEERFARMLEARRKEEESKEEK